MSNAHPPVTLPGTEVRIFHSKYVDQDYKLDIYLPWGYADSDESYPVLYVADGNFFHFRFLWSFSFPPLIVVGIGYATDNYADQVRLRARDFLPTKNEEEENKNKELFQMEFDSGGGEHFLSFIREELFAFINDHYRTKPDDRVYYGHSYGGTFGIYTLFKLPETFSRYIIVSPVLTWDDNLCFAYEHEYSEKHADLPVKLYLGVGTLEESPNHPLVSKLVKFHSIIKSRNYKGLDMKLDLLQDETHLTAVIPAAQWGVRSVFDID